jgi:hypothetical protein
MQTNKLLTVAILTHFVGNFCLWQYNLSVVVSTSQLSLGIQAACVLRHTKLTINRRSKVFIRLFPRLEKLIAILAKVL